MLREKLLSVLEDDKGNLIPKRCTERYLRNAELIDTLDQLVPNDFGTVNERIKHLKYGGGHCLVCSKRTTISPTGRGFTAYCSEHFHQPKKGKVAHNKKQIDISLVRHLYLEQQMSIVEISKHLGNISNVSLKNKMIEAGIAFRTHSDNQKLHSKPGPVGPKIIIDRIELVDLYTKQKMPISILADRYQCSQETIRRFLIQEDIERTNRRSSIEWLIIDILDRHNIAYRTNAKNIIPPFELDIFLKEYNMAIEINGLYTHSLYTGQKDKLYHHNKFIRCKERGIRLLQLWENDIRNKLPVIESMILHRCGKSTTSIDARKCTVDTVPFSMARQFYMDSHIQGSPAKSTKTYGLFYEGVLVAAIGFVYTKTHTTIVRYCCANSHNVRGGFTKLIARLPKPLVTYSSNDISWGDLYHNNGFRQVSKSKYDLWYTDYQEVFNRQIFMKQKLASHKMINIFDADLSEIENMYANGFDAIYKSGTSTWRLT